jgi:hypothetical protein
VLLFILLFSFCKTKPLVWLYGGERPDDDNAMKAAGLELQGLGLIATSQMTQLHVPLMALVCFSTAYILCIVHGCPADH